MRLAQVTGQVVATVKDAELHGMKLLVCRDFAADGTTTDATFVAVDLVGAGRGEVVLVAEGSAARTPSSTSAAPVDAAVVAIADSVIADEHVTYSK